MDRDAMTYEQKEMGLGACDQGRAQEVISGREGMAMGGGGDRPGRTWGGRRGERRRPKERALA